MGVVGHVIGGAAFGLAARFWQLGILKKPMLSNPVGHLASTVFFAGTGYYWWQGTVYMKGVLEEQEHKMRLRRDAQMLIENASLDKALNRSSSE
ncbi:unnamed protein product [Mycena citricolor]|uniref:Uncharacterized protein n=1 Tax=Mycena citricolor TaxID=2018698 RepID=A0AAD2H4S1_9AGAR|nr:unnamed protein product [Mycena citricolor]CAK5269311.1 unnamed protein product [Mycena citricolor]CAK5269443.1 unnamed protein product [Mycena citricolor]